MRYFIRSIKYFFYFSTFTALIVGALVLTGMAEGDINQIFDGGYQALWKIALFFAVVAAFYPKVGFIDRLLYVKGDDGVIRQVAKTLLHERRYEIETETADCITFRIKGIGSRLIKMNEDRITLKHTPEGWRMEGLRKDVMRLSSGIENRLFSDN